MNARLFGLLVLSLLVHGLLAARDSLEAQRIEHLLQSVESLKGAAFIRNGAEHDGKAAGAHLRMKLKKAGNRVKTAEDFIEGCATRSLLSGTPYQIRMPDGTLTEAAAFLRARLRDYDQARRGGGLRAD